MFIIVFSLLNYTFIEITSSTKAALVRATADAAYSGKASIDPLIGTYELLLCGSLSSC